MKITKTMDTEFDWSRIGNISKGRINLGSQMPVEVYRLFEFTMLDELATRFGEKVSHEIFRGAGKRAGIAFAQKHLDMNLDFASFIGTLSSKLLELKIGVLRVEKTTEEGHITVIVSEDLDCSGLSIIGETICHYDEGFIQGILETYTGKTYSVEEVDCWAKGDRVCRFHALCCK